MNRDDVLDLCASLPGAVEDYPFGDGVAVFKVGGRMFALVALDGSPGFVNLKCDPTLALELRALHSSIRPGYHANKRHWNTVELDCSVDDSTLREMIQRSYELVVSRLPAMSEAQARLLERREVVDAIDAFLDDPDTGVRRGRPTVVASDGV